MEHGLWGLAIATALLILADGIHGRGESPPWGGYYRDNGTHYFLYAKPSVVLPNVRPQSPLANVSSNPFVNSLLSPDYLPTRIVGGKRMSIEEVPFQCSLHFEGIFICGCVIINGFWVGTAGHCDIGDADQYKVRCGTENVNRGGELRNVQLVIRNPDYDDYTMRNDLTMMKLRKPVKFSKYVQPCRLPSPKVTRFPRQFLVSGWGVTSANAQHAQKYLRGVEVDLIRRGKCQKDYKGTGVKIYKDMICASRLHKDSCSGDSGGPLSHDGICFGFVSFGIGCANPKYPGVYVNLKRYIPWIKKCIREN
ncbi:hypothetical protein KR009_000014 [Drosophila setifemur]|nr:hypothetical protein KR009_000014 [Drosophila setifemur]